MKTRFAPSPTGTLHIGGARTALYNYLLAKKQGGPFVLRIEDTDAERNTQESLHNLLEELTWLGLTWDEGPKTHDPTQYHGDCGPYCQSQRHAIYHEHAEKLLAKGQAYYCFADEETIEQQREASADKYRFQFQSPWQSLPLAEARKKLANGEPAVVRYRNTHHDDIFRFDDLVRGPIELPGNMVGDFVLLRRDGSPVYNFCCAVDDATMAITHILRGEEHLPNTLRQLMIYEALDLPKPAFGHLSLILDQDQKKLSKRSGASSISDFRELGYTPEGLLNYLALLGWSDPEHREILSLDDMVASFSTERLNPAAPMYDMDKMRWVNSQHLRKYATSRLADAITPFIAPLHLPQKPAWLIQALSFFQQDLHTLAEAHDIFRLYTLEPAVIADDAHEAFAWEHTPAILHAWLDALLTEAEKLGDPNPKQALHTLLDSLTQTQNHDLEQALLAAKKSPDKISPSFLFSQAQSLCPASQEANLSAETYQILVKAIQGSVGAKGKQLFMPIRIAMIGTPHGSDMKIIIQLLTLQQLILRAVYATIAAQTA
jgi:nondiscriminating glutamyl-tRNA synthetase